MKNKTIISIAFFMIFLIIALPFYISDAYAQDVSRIDKLVYPTPTGMGNASGYMLPTDILFITANLRAKDIAAAEIASHVFFVAGSEKEPFSSCNSLDSGWYDCTFQKSYTDLYPGVYSGNIILEAPECSGCEKPFQIIVDGKSPSVQALGFSPAVTNSTELSVSYSVSDSACNGNECKGRCSGIDRIVFYQANNVGNLQIMGNITEQGKCDISEIKTANISKLASGKYSFCVAAFDKAGNGNLLNGTCSNVVIDRDPPVASTPVITDSSGKIISYLPGPGASAEIQLNITSNYANLTTAIADLSSFGFSNSTLSCNNIAGTRIWNCRAGFTAALPTDSAAQTISIFTQDNAGNRGKTDFVFGIKIDKSAPELSNFRTSYMFNNTPFFGRTNNIMVLDIKETGSGFGKNQTYVAGLDKYFNVISRGAGTLYQSWCSVSAGGWRCYWPALTLRSSDSVASLDFKIIDDTGNELNAAKRIRIDTKNPVINAITVHTPNAFPAIGAGENVVVRVNITDDTAIIDDSGNSNVYLDLTKFEGGTSMRKADSCQLLNANYSGEGLLMSSDWMCAWLVQGAKEVSGWQPKLNVSDITGNTFSGYPDAQNNYLVSISPLTGNSSYTLKAGGFDVFPKELNVSDYWKVEASGTSPDMIDRQIAPVVETNVYSHLAFTSLQGSPERIAVTLESCSNDGTARDFAIFPDTPIDPWIETIVNRGSYGTISALSYVCTIGTTSISNGVLSQKEFDNVTISIALYNMPLGQIDTSIEDKLDQARSWTTNDFLKILGTLNKVFTWGQTICSLFKTLTTVWIIVSSIAQMPPLWKEACAAIQICKPVEGAHTAGEIGIGLADTTFEKVATPICKFVNCGFSKDLLKRINEVLTPSVLNLLQAPDTSSHPVLSRIGSGAMLAGGGFFPSDPSQSLILSIFTLCLPGAIYNFEKFRQIICQRGVCLVTMSQQGGPLYACDEMYRNQMCAAVVGEVFSLIPFGSVLSAWGGLVSGMLSNPLSFVMTVTWIACLPLFIGAPTPGSVCDIANAVKNGISFVVGLVNQYQTLKEKLKKGWEDSDQCTAFSSLYDQLEEQRNNATASGITS